MATETDLKTTTIDGLVFRIRPLEGEKQYWGVGAYLVDDVVWEWWDESEGEDHPEWEHPSEVGEEIVTFGIESVTNILDVAGTVVGFVCPICECEVLFAEAVEYADSYVGCSGECVAVVAKIPLSCI